MHDLKQEIRQAASQLGFSRCRFARCEGLPHAEFVRRWVAEGQAGEMAYIERGLAKRLDPRLLVPEVRSIISVAYRYRPPPAPAVDWREQLRGRIAAYALGPDYHDVMAKQLGALAHLIGGLGTGVIARGYIDTGPVLEREWAAKSGVGWFGKNTNLLHTEDGSWFFLAEILTSLELEPDEPVKERCGKCTRCLDRCPTGALRPGYELDARLCLSYLTIEHRGPIQPALRPLLGNWVFGCDICQEVCPWNERFARRHTPPQSELLFPHLPELLLLTEEAFRQRFRRTAIWRTRRAGLARNAAVVLGNTGNPAAVPALRTALTEDPAGLVRGHAAWALGQLAGAGAAARRALEAARAADPEPEVRAEAETALQMQV